MKTYGFFVFSMFGFLLNAQHQDKVDFVRASILVEPIPLQKQIKGDVTYEFNVLADVDSIFLDAHNMVFVKVLLDNIEVPYSNDGKTIGIKQTFIKQTAHELQLEYTAVPKQTVYFVGYNDNVTGNEQIWTQGQGKYTSHWLPSFDAMEEKVEFDLNIKAPNGFTVIANGKLVKYSEDDSSAKWQFDMQHPMSSYLLAFAMGNYNKQQLVSKSGVTIENYYYPKDSLKVEPTYRYTKEIFNFLETEIGIPYPWQNYKQVPVHDFLYAGMENTGATIFSDGFIIDSTAFVDKNYVNVNAHELAHQWFGNLVTEQSGEDHWLHEGFATYYAYLAEKELFGDDHFYWQLYGTAQQLKERSEKGEGESLLNPKSSSLTFYEKGAWALAALRELIGEEPFRKGIKKYLTFYKYKNATVFNFIKELERASGQDLTDYFNKWLTNDLFLWEEAKTHLLKKSASLRMYHKVKDMAGFSQFRDTTVIMEVKNQLILDSEDKITKTDLFQLLTLPELELRQTLAKTIGPIPQELQELAEPLLLDKSYITQEMMLYNLWTSFPEDRSTYLEQTKNVIGLPNKNVRLLWLTLALVTPEYRIAEKLNFLNELAGYTKSEYHPEIRQMAFQYTRQIGAMNTEVLTQLIKATNHHSWQFRNSSRRLLDELLKDENSKAQLQVLIKELNTDDLRYLKTKM